MSLPLFPSLWSALQPLFCAHEPAFANIANTIIIIIIIIIIIYHQ